MEEIKIKIEDNKRIFFASDFHLGAPNQQESREREDRIVRWLNSVKSEMQALFLVGDVFDFWFEYRHVVPKGYVRFLGKLAELSDDGIPIYLFHGNHDMWISDYLKVEIGATIYSDLAVLDTGTSTICIGHGDGLGAGDYTYKFLKKIFRNPLAQWLFKWIHPTVGFGLATSWSSHSRLSSEVEDQQFVEGQEWLFQYCKDLESTSHHDYYVFGHRHLPMSKQINETSIYVNLGEWVNFSTYASYDGRSISLSRYEG